MSSDPLARFYGYYLALALEERRRIDAEALRAGRDEIARALEAPGTGPRLRQLAPGSLECEVARAKHRHFVELMLERCRQLPAELAPASPAVAAERQHLAARLGSLGALPGHARTA